ncbi:MAG: flavin reductase family protein [Pseudomonadota bacterium]|nr:flavin reductase family protein [Pseudomonadota bacterium]
MESQGSFDSRAFRSALGNFATGVTIVTTRSEVGDDVGVTANSFNSVSLNPPMILWSLSRKALSLAAFQNNPYFAVHILASDQDSLSARFATPGADKFAGLSIERGEGEVPLLEGCAARFRCRTAFRHEGGDHVILVGEVLGFDSWHRPPLLYHAGRYAFAVEKRSEVPHNDEWNSEPDSSFSRDFLIYLLGRAHFQMFRGLHPELARHAISKQEWFVLSVLGVADNRSIAELDRLLWVTGPRVSYELLAGLAAAGLVELHGGHDPSARATLSEKGRGVVVQLVAAAKAAEAHAERNLGPGETLVLKSALRKLISDTDPGVPQLLTSSDED